MNNFKYSCDCCSFYTNVKQNYNTHLLTRRHKRIQDNEQFNHICIKCNKKFKHHSGLYQHRPKCKAPEPATVNNQEQNTLILETVVELKTMVEDLKANQKPTIINNNINIILNEHFKPNKDFIEFIKGINFSASYPPTISSDGYVDTVSEAVKTEIDKLPIDERPIFCIKNEAEDQNIIHVRSDNTWIKETELDWTSQIHSSYFTEYDESQKKIIFKALEHLEQKLKNRIRSVHGQAAENEYRAEMSHPPNKIQIIKCVMEYVNMERDELMKIINETYNELQHKT
jgi:hypothetical protein